MKISEIAFTVTLFLFACCLVLYYMNSPLLSFKKYIVFQALSNLVVNKTILVNDKNDSIAPKSKNYSLNKRFMINKNIAQYSSYLIIDEESLKVNSYKIEAFIHLNHKYIHSFGGKENFKCLAKIEDTINRKEEILELEAVDAPDVFWKNNRKLVFILNLENSLVLSQKMVNFDKIAVAVIWKNDYDKSLDFTSFINKFDGRQALPYSLIRFQIPTIIRSVEPRSKSVSLCIHYTYSVPPHVLTWFSTHFEFGVREIMIYDSTTDLKLTEILNEKYLNDERLKIIPFKITLSDLCDDKLLFEQFTESTCPLNVRNYMKESCKDFFSKEFSESIEWRWHFEQITANDCFTIMSRKHEFIGRYDLDEYIRPRSFNSLNDRNYDNKNTSICLATPFFYVNRTHNSKTDVFYNYVISLVENNRNGREISKLSSIRFNNALYLPSEGINAKTFIGDLGNLIKIINTSSNLKFPMYLYLKNFKGDNFKNGYKFYVEKTDFEYIDNLYKSYNGFISMAFESYLKNISDIGHSLVRYMYVSIGRKEIHYYKNVKSIYHHNHLSTERDSWTFNASFINKDFVGHFRNDMPSWLFDGSLSGSIRNMNFDFEHIFYLLKKYTKFCNNLNK